MRYLCAVVRLAVMLVEVFASTDSRSSMGISSWILVPREK